MKANTIKRSLISVNNSYEGEPIERELEKIMSEGTELAVTGPPIYTAKKDGVLPEYNIRTDRFDIGQEAMGKINIQRMNYKPWEDKPEGGSEGESKGSSEGGSEGGSE